MAIVSSHLLSSTDGSHASGVKVIINQIKKNGSRRKIFQSKTDKNGSKTDKPSTGEASKKDAPLPKGAVDRSSRTTVKPRN